MSNLVSREVDIKLIHAIETHCPDLPKGKKHVILKALRYNYYNFGVVKQKLNQGLSIVNIYSALIAHSRHTHMKYSGKHHLKRRHFNNHAYGKAIFEQYYAKVIEISELDNLEDKLWSEQIRKIANQ